MKTQKRILKIGLSLMIAFIMLSSTLVFADGPEAGVTDIKTQPNLEQYEALRKSTDPIAQQGCPVWIIGLVSIDLGPDNNIQEGTYPIEIILWNEPGCGPATVKVFTDIYRKTEGQHITMYETSFEDNFDIYNNWIQIDADCGEIGGHYDSWSWSDARAFTGDHSFKSTMYDIYKGNQDDYLQCTKSFDMSNQEAIEVEFMAWVEGDGLDFAGYYWPYDYLDFEVGDQFGNWFNPYVSQSFLMASMAYALGGSYYFFDTSIPLYNGYYYNKDYTPIAEDMGGGWWKITYTVSVAALAAMQLDVTDIMFRFSWHTDPEYQFEGAYVDDFKVVSIESTETKVFQTHSQGHFVIPECESKYTFPLPWIAVGDDSKELCYDIRIWLEVIDPEHYSMNDWPEYLDIYVCVSDWFDVEVVDGSLEIETSFGGETVIPGDGIINYGDDAHIMAQIHVDGTLPATDITVTASAQAKNWDVLYETDFESGMGWTLSNGAHLTDTKAFSGSQSLGMFEEEFQRYINDAFYVAEYAGTFSAIDNIELFMDFYSISITETNYDRSRPCLVDNYHNFVLGMSPTQTGYRPDWIGPMQPMSTYQSYDLLDAYDYFETAYGFFHDGNGDQIYDIPIGFYMTSDSTVNGYGTVMESGVWYDDVSVRGLQLGDTVWSDIIVIPGPIEPSETVDVQFEWEDLPYSNYLICIEVDCAGARGNLGDEPECAQVLVVTDLEMAHWKEMESHDYTGEGNGEWGISTSDTDNYLATNADGTIYEANSNAIAQLCPGGDSIIDISSLFTPGGTATVTLLFEDFEASFPPWGWEDSTWGGPYSGSYWAYSNTAGETMTLPTQTIDMNGALDFWYRAESSSYPQGIEVFVNAVLAYSDYGFTHTSYINTGAISLPSGTVNIDIVNLVGTGGWDYGTCVEDITIQHDTYVSVVPPTSLNMTFDAWWDLDAFYDYVFVEVANAPCDTIDDWNIVASYTWDSLLYGGDDDGWVQETVDLVFPGIGEEICVRFRFTSDGSWEFRGMKIDNLEIDGIFGPDPMNNLNNWCLDIMHYGQFWEYDDVENQWCTDFPAVDVNDGLIWSTEISDAYEAYLVYETEYALGASEGFVQISADGGDSWFTLDVFTGTSAGWETYHHNLNYWVGNDILIRFLAVGGGSAGHWCVKGLTITGKEDNSAPNTQATMSGDMADAGWYRTSVDVVITATDVGAGMGEIHYILDGVTTVKSGESTSFTVSVNGVHNIEYWGVDKVGNEETPHNIIPTFRIDAGAPPSVAITEPTTGLYLFGNKLLSLSKIFIIGAFNIEATASDAESGVYKVVFELDGDVIAEDTEAPYSAYCAIKHSGAGTIKVTAYDFSGNFADDTLDITYYKFL